MKELAIKLSTNNFQKLQIAEEILSKTTEWVKSEKLLAEVAKKYPSILSVGLSRKYTTTVRLLLSEMVEAGLLEKTGEKRGVSYRNAAK